MNCSVEIVQMIAKGSAVFSKSMMASDVGGTSKGRRGTQHDQIQECLFVYHVDNVSFISLTSVTCRSILINPGVLILLPFFQDQYEIIDKHTQWGLDLVEKYVKFVKERTEIEQNYAKQLR